MGCTGRIVTNRALAVCALLASLAAGIPGVVAQTDDAGAGVAGQASEPISGRVTTPEERAACVAEGGEILPSGAAGYDLCIHTHSDAGQPCTDSSGCIGRCLNAGAFVDFRAPATSGQCTGTDSPFGCTQLVVGGRADHAICVD